MNSFVTHRKKLILCIDKVAILCELHYTVAEEEIKLYRGI